MTALSITTWSRQVLKLFLVLAPSVIQGCTSDATSTVTPEASATASPLSIKSPEGAQRSEQTANAAPARGQKRGKRFTGADADTLKSTYSAAFLSMARDVKQNRAKWFGTGDVRQNPKAFCAGLTALYAKHLPAIALDGGATLDGAGRNREAKRFLEATVPACAKQNAMSVFGVAVEPALSASRPMPVAMQAMDEATATAYAEENITVDWAMSQTGSAQAEIEATVSQWEGSEQWSIFAQGEKWRQIRLAGASGCTGFVYNQIGNIRRVFVTGAMIGGPVSGLIDAAFYAGGICAIGGFGGAFAAWLLW